MTDGLYLGLISGTSADGIDAALVDCAADRPELRAAATFPYEPALARRVRAAIAAAGKLPLAETCALDLALGEAFAAAALELIRANGLGRDAIAALGSHGQTLHHAPPASVQVGNGALIAHRTRITTVADFRAADLAAGGQGAPLAPLLHRALFARDDARVGVVNIGGIANLTVLDAGGGIEAGFDTGPGNCLLDAWHARHRDGPYDRDGAWAATGSVATELLDALREDAYFTRLAPKSTGREHFDLDWLERRAPDLDALASEDVQATLTALTAHTIAEAAGERVLDCLLVCGGGVHNGLLMRELAALLPRTEVQSTAVAGVDPDFIEAMLFAWLARRRLTRQPVYTKAVTGADLPVLPGAAHRAP